MKNKNMRELEKRWAEEAAKKRKGSEAPKKKASGRKDVNPSAVRTVKEATSEKEP
jgi:hypothetical protein